MSPYQQGGQRTLVQLKIYAGYIVWNWDTAKWDHVWQPIEREVE